MLESVPSAEKFPVWPQPRACGGGQAAGQPVAGTVEKVALALEQVRFEMDGVELR